MTGTADVNIQPAIGIHIGKHNTCVPFIILNYASFFADVFKLKIALVEVKFIGTRVGCEKYISKSVIIYISNANTATVVKISEEKTVFQLIVFYCILKIYSGRIHQLKQSR